MSSFLIVSALPRAGYIINTNKQTYAEKANKALMSKNSYNSYLATLQGFISLIESGKSSLESSNNYFNDGGYSGSKIAGGDIDTCVSNLSTVLSSLETVVEHVESKIEYFQEKYDSYKSLFDSAPTYIKIS